MLTALRSWLARRPARPTAAARPRLGCEWLEDRTVPTAWAPLDGGDKDLTTGLVWFPETNHGLGSSSYQFAVSWIADSTRNGFDDWRLPNLPEARWASANGIATIYGSSESNPLGGYGRTWTTTAYDSQQQWTVKLHTGEEGPLHKRNAYISTAMLRDSAAYVDDGGTGFTTVGTWSQSGGYLGDSRTATAGDGSKSAMWTFSGLEAGATYRIAATWTAAAGNATNAPYLLLDGSQMEGTVTLDQSAAPDDYLIGGTGWETLGDVTADSGQLSVRLNNLANGAVRADAIRIFKVPGTPLPPRVSVSNASVVEGSAGSTTQLAFTVTRSGDLTQAVTVDFVTADGTATAGSDYAAAADTLTFEPGVTTRTVYVTVFGDDTVEPNESFTLVLSNATGASIVNGTAVGTIVNDDIPPPALSINDVTKSEGRNGVTYFTFYVTRTGDLTQAVTVDYATANGTATAGSDYAAASGTLTFAPGETTKTITISVYGDRTKELNETFFVNLSGAFGADILDGLGVGTIQNDD